MPDTWDATSRDYIEGRENEIVNNHAQYVSIVRTGIGNTTLLLGGEVDAGTTVSPFYKPPNINIYSVWDIKPEPPHTRINWVELKTSVSPQSDRDFLAFERKLLKFWIQSFLLGVPKIIVGFRDQNGILIRTEEMETEKIPGTVKRRGKATWDGNMCINFAASFLECELFSLFIIYKML
jgi:RAT1-interacting protein